MYHTRDRTIVCTLKTVQRRAIGLWCCARQTATVSVVFSATCSPLFRFAFWLKLWGVSNIFAAWQVEDTFNSFQLQRRTDDVDYTVICCCLITPRVGLQQNWSARNWSVEMRTQLFIVALHFMIIYAQRNSQVY